MAAQSSRNLTQLKLQAKELREAHRAGDTTACARFRAHLHRLPNSTDAEIRQYALSLREAQHVIARENGFDSWATLKNQTRAPSTSETITRAVVTDQQLTKTSSSASPSLMMNSMANHRRFRKRDGRSLH